MRTCKRCLIPVAVPGTQIDSDGVCNLCKYQEHRDLDGDEQLRQEREDDLEEALQSCRQGASYDCVVPLSGGKDSIYLLYKLKREYQLKVLAFTTDINLPPIAWNNIRTALRKLDIDHVVYRPSSDFYAKLFRYLLKNQEERGAVYTISYVYAPLFEGDAIRLAAEKEIPLVLAGYSPGQPDPERMEYEFSRTLIEKVTWVPPQLERSGEFSRDELERFFDPRRFPSNTEFPRYLAPFHAWKYAQDDVMDAVVRLGLIRSHKNASPVFSNYPINWLLMYSDLKNLGYNPYLPEFSALIREGKASRDYWRIMVPIVNTMIRHRILLGRDVTRSLKWLGLSTHDLRITMARGAYDPEIIGSAEGCK
jgi:hypothetical protein